MKNCRVCGNGLGPAVYEAPAPALTSIFTAIDIPTAVHLCGTCGHAQGPDLPDIQAFYDTQYRISLESDDHDQIFATGADGTPIYRTDHQTAISLDLLGLQQDALVLDFGAAKAGTLRKITARRPDVVPHVFDVSSDYRDAWQGWVLPENQATYQVPPTWQGKFDAVMSHFVIEHVADPVAFLKTIRQLLKPEGLLLLSLPDVSGNPGDMAVVDHLNHFSQASLSYAFNKAGFNPVKLDTTSFPGACFAVATPAVIDDVEDVPDATAVAQAVAQGISICEFWQDATRRIDAAAKRYAGKRCAIYGAGFYGSWIHGHVKGALDIAAFLDQNPNLQGTTHFGHDVIAPADLPEDIEVVFMGLNPLKARAVAAQVPALSRQGLDLVWLGG